MEPGVSEKLHKVLANLGYGSRRQIEELIRKGKVTVDGEPASVGMRIGPEQNLAIGERKVSRAPVLRRVLLYNKPAGEEVSRTPGAGRPCVFGALPPPKTGKWLNVGRLDVDTQGLLLFTNDGEFAHLISHPSAKLERTYRARVDGKLSPEELREVRDGLATVGGRAVTVGKISLAKEPSGRNAWYKVSVMEGRNRVVRRLFERYGLSVSKLERIGFGPVRLSEDLKRGEWRELNPRNVARLESEALKSRRLAGRGSDRGAKSDDGSL